MLKLSELSDEFEIVSDYAGKMEVGEVKSEITEYGQDATKHKWYVPITQTWKADAGHMLESYIENEYDSLYEGWDDKAYDCLTKEVRLKIQAILDEAFSGSPVTEYWEFGEEVEIDILPQAIKTTESPSHGVTEAEAFGNDCRNGQC